MNSALPGINATVSNQRGFTLVEIIAVLVILGILAAMTIPKYMDMAEKTRQRSAQGLISEVKGRLSLAFTRYLLYNGGEAPEDGSVLVDEANTASPNSCPTTDTTEGDFKFKCEGSTSAKTVIITVSEVQGVLLTPGVTGSYTFN